MTFGPIRLKGPSPPSAAVSGPRHVFMEHVKVELSSLSKDMVGRVPSFCANRVGLSHHPQTCDLGTKEVLAVLPSREHREATHQDSLVEEYRDICAVY